MLFAFSSFSSAACFGSVSCLRSVTLQLVDSLFYSQLNSRQPRQATQTGEHTPGHPANNSRNECNIQIKNELSRLVSWLAGRMVCMEIKFRQKFQHSCWHPQNFCSTFLFSGRRCWCCSGFRWMQQIPTRLIPDNRQVSQQFAKWIKLFTVRHIYCLLQSNENLIRFAFPPLGLAAVFEDDRYPGRPVMILSSTFPVVGTFNGSFRECN